MQALVTGAGGFTGRHLVDYLHQYGCSVSTLGRRKIPGTSHYHLSLDSSSICKVIAEVRPDYLFHLAGCVNSSSLAEFFNVNVMFATYLLEALDSIGLSEHTRTLIVGSAAEYGEVPEETLPISEDVISAPYSLYGVSKLAQTQMSLKWAQPNRRLVVVRPFTIIGPGMPNHMAIGNFVNQIKATLDRGGKGMITTGNLEVERDFICISDVLKIYWKLLHTDASFGKVINVCSGKPTSLKVMLSYLLKKSLGSIDIKRNTELTRSIDMKTHYGDNRLLFDLIEKMKLTPWEKSMNLILKRL